MTAYSFNPYRTYKKEFLSTVRDEETEAYTNKWLA